MAKSGSRFAIVVVVVVIAAAAAMKLFGGGVAPVPAAFANGLSIEQAIERSTTTGRPVLVLMTADWCGPCQRFKRGPLSEPAVAQYIGGHFEPVYVDIEKDGELAGRLGVESIPAMRILRPGRSPAALNDYADAESVMRWFAESTAP